MTGPADWQNKRVTVMGLGLFSGGVAVTRFLVRHGARVTVTDLKDEDELAESVAAVRDLGVRLVLGRHEEQDFADADWIVKSPAVPETSAYLKLARERGVAITSEVRLFFAYCRAPIVGVTGSNGKSTTTALLGAMLAETERTTHVGGNIGRSLIDEVDSIAPDDLVVMELSSFQLEDLGELRRSPRGAVVTNLSPNHLDRHGTYENYCRAKENIVRFQTKDDFAVLNADDKDLATWAPACGRVRRFSVRGPVADGACLEGEKLVLKKGGCPLLLLSRREIPLIGEHNVENVLAAAAAADALGASTDAIATGVRRFKGLPHRIEHVGCVDGIDCYNDSIATTPESTIRALCSFDRPVLLVAGGYDKGAEFHELAREIRGSVRALVLIGKTAERIRACLDEGDGLPQTQVLLAETIEDAVDVAIGAGQPGDVLLLSPACASYDMFTNFVERGNRFTAAVRARAERG